MKRSLYFIYGKFSSFNVQYIHCSVVDIWNDLLNSFVSAPKVKTFEARLDKFWVCQPIKYDYKSLYKLTGRKNKLEPFGEELVWKDTPLTSSTNSSRIFILSAVQDVDMTYSFGTSRSRGSLARTIYNRMAVDEQHQMDDHAYWYTVDTIKLPEELCEKFLQCHQDSETSDFLDNCYNKADWVFTQIGHSLARSFLSWFMAATSINGLLGRGSMFVFSRSQFMNLLEIPATWKGENLLDLGAGDGEVTKMMSPNFRNVFATETSFSMVSRLKHRGYKILEISGWDDGTVLFDVVSCLNLLDRCDQPISILHSIKRSLKPDGLVIVAIVLPFKPYVEFGSASNKPSQNIILNGTSFEEQVTSLVKDVFEPAGFSLVKFTRLPYLCEGDMETSFYVLDDAVFVLRVTEKR